MGGNNRACLEALCEYLRKEHLDKKQEEYSTDGFQVCFCVNLVILSERQCLQNVSPPPDGGDEGHPSAEQLLGLRNVLLQVRRVSLPPRRHHLRSGTPSFMIKFIASRSSRFCRMWVTKSLVQWVCELFSESSTVYQPCCLLPCSRKASQMNCEKTKPSVKVTVTW